MSLRELAATISKSGGRRRKASAPDPLADAARKDATAKMAKALGLDPSKVDGRKAATALRSFLDAYEDSDDDDSEE